MNSELEADHNSEFNIHNSKLIWGPMSQSRLWLLNNHTGPPCMNDADLVAGLQRGDADTVEYFVQEYAPALYRVAYYQLGHATAAQDLASEVTARVSGPVGGVV